MSLSSNPFRLSHNVRPESYRIFLTPDLDAASFSGRVEIDVLVAEPTTQVTLNAKNLEVGAASLTSAGTTLRSDAPKLDATYETADFAFPDEIGSGPATIEIAFTGVLNDQLAGFYRSTFTDAEGERRTIATTQFEQCDARQAFPCFDEPAFKATFQVTLTVPTHLAAYANSREVANVDLGNGQRTVTFAPTMKMSTYLVAFVVGPFEETPAIDVDGTAMRVIYPVGRGGLGDSALEAGRHALQFLSAYFDISYPGDKLDMVAIPDFAFGAMENTGLVTYREADLLLDPATSSLAERQRTAEIIAHELAHMWFGNLVTMEWWEGIWLNEAFATFMQILCTDDLRPDWHMWTDFATLRDEALNVDGLHSTRSIEYEVVSPEDTRAMFDSLTYWKGGSVLRMLEQYLGAEVFRDGIRHYLRRHSYANTVTADLWRALEEVSDEPVGAVMNDWILQGGHPLVSLENGQLVQEPFHFGASTGESAIGHDWHVPILTRSLDESHVSHHLLGAEALSVDDTAPVLANAGGSGVFRTRYPSADLATLASRLDELTQLERFTMVADTWALVLAGRSTWADLLVVARGLSRLDEPHTWAIIARAFDMADRALLASQRPGLTQLVREIFLPVHQRLGWEAAPGEDERTDQLRALAIGTLGTLGEDESVRDAARARYESGAIEGNLARAILQVVAHEGREKDYGTFHERRRRASTPQEERRYLLALADFPVRDLALDAAEKCFSEFRNQDASTELGLLERNRVTGPDVWRYVVSRWDDVMNVLPPNYRNRVALGTPTFIADDDFAREVLEFHATHSVGGEQPEVDQHMERLRNGLALRDRLRTEFEA